MSNATSLNYDSMDALRFRIYGKFLGKEDRSTEEFNKGKFFNFRCMGGDFQVPFDLSIPDQASIWSSPPEVGRWLWVAGNLVTNRFTRIILEAFSLESPSERFPAQDSLDQLEGGYFEGVAALDKSAFKRQSGVQGYKILIRAFGLLYSYTFDDENLYNQFPEKELLVLRGRLRFKQAYYARYGKHATLYSLVPTSAIAVRELIARRNAAESANGPDTNHNSREGARRQAPQDAKKQPNE